jgi:hypothetical protein
LVLRGSLPHTSLTSAFLAHAKSIIEYTIICLSINYSIPCFMPYEESLLSLPWHLLAKKRAGTATPPELAELEAWFARHAPAPTTSTTPPLDAEATEAWQRMQARARRDAPPSVA